MATLASMTVRLGIDTDRLREGVEDAKQRLVSLGKVVGGLGVGVPAMAGVATAAGGMAAAFASAGIAAKAFQLAAQPQLEAVAEASTAAEKAEEAHELAVRKKAEAQQLATKGGEAYKQALKEAEAASKAAKTADAEYEAQLAGMPKTTREMAKEFQGLKGDYEDWSNSLSSSTMPVFTKGLRILRDLLPTLTPFVEQASKALSGFLDEVAQGVKSAGFKQWADDMAAASGTSLTDFLTVVKNLAVGFGGLLAAFTPASDNVTGGLVKMSGAFADWGTSLQGSEGFAQFLDLARSGGETLGNLAGAVLNLVVALAPLLGATTILINLLAQIVSSIPTPVLTVLAGVLITVRVGMLTYAAATKTVTVAQTILRASIWSTAMAWTRSAAASIAAMTRTAATATVTAARTAGAWALAAARATATWLVTIIRVAVTSVAQFALMMARAIVWAATMAAQWLIAMGPIGWITAAVIALVALIVANWETIKRWTLAAWDWVWNKVKQVAQFLIDLFLNFTLVGLIIKHWSTIKTKTVEIWNAVVAWVKGLPQKLINFFLNWTLPGLIIKHWQSIKDGTIRKAGELVSWVKGLPGRIVRAVGSLGSLLYDKGKDIIRGLLDGVKSMGTWLKNQLMSFAKSMIPGPIAKALGISSPSKLLADQVGHWLPPGIAEGALDNLAPLRNASADLAAAAVPDLPTANVRGMSRVEGAGREPLVVDVTGGDEDLVRLLRKWIKRNGRGDVQFALSG